ncbi:MAG: porin [Gemmatimonadales bacterium]
MRHLSIAVAWVACALALLPGTGGAQQPADPRVDSLLAEIRALKARLDSLTRRDTTTDALARLRARAQAAAQRGDTTPPPPVAGPRNLNQLNPEISVTGDFRGAIQTDGPQRENFEAREFEFAFQSALDPYSHTKIFAAIEEGEIDIEEAYFYYTGLPGRVRLDLGRYRQQLGELNRWHLHAVPEAEYPLALLTYTGEEGLIGTGLSAYWNTAGLGTHELWAQVTRGTNELLFEDGDRPAYLVHLNNFWPLGRATYMQLGATGVYGTNPDSSLKTRLGTVDFRFTWRPPARARYREWNLRGELFAVEKERGGLGETRYGWYVGTNYKLGQRWVAGVRYDYVEAPEGPLAIVRQVVPSLTYWQSEWVKLHAEWQHRREAGATDDLIVLQAVWSIGPHKHEIY